MNEPNKDGTRPDTTEISSGESKENPEPAPESKGEENTESNSPKGNGDRPRKRTSIVKKNAEGIRRRSNEIVQFDRKIEWLRNYSEPRDLAKFKEATLNETAGFGGLRSQVVFSIMALEKKIFHNYSDADLSRYLFFLGIRRDKVPEILERVSIYEELYFEFVEDRIKQEKDWREP